ncbi:MAG: 16S rRNA (cytidine(1402)-2'-O)-methyltransferase [Parcubacteria group bacterium]|nr:16S rRNA (cytidine(1402)-2'-O)-methyltransferase [Parcubacteria group bacterium]
MSTLYIVGTPIGNLEDISLRALRVLGEVDFILSEDTRVTAKLLKHYNIKTPAISYHQHSAEDKTEKIIDFLASGKNLALVSDAGMPGISDPGGKLIQRVIEKFGAANESPVQIESVPGPSAVTAALSISGLPTDKFIFMGWPPHKKGRQTFIRRVLASDYPAVIYESKHRLVRFLEELKKAAEENRQANKNGRIELKPTCSPACAGRRRRVDLTSVVVCRELSKMHETVYRGEISKIIEKIKASPNDQKGEFVVIVGK